MKDSRFIRISYVEATRLIESENGKIHVALSSAYEQNVYKTSKERFVVLFDTHGFVYKDYNSITSHINETNNIDYEEFMIDSVDLIGDGISFIKRKDSIRQDFLIITGIKYPKNGKLTIGFLKEVELFFNKRKDIASKDAFFPGLVAYLGDYIAMKTDGEWIVNDGEILFAKPYPSVKGKDGKVYDPFLIAYKELFEYLPLDGEVRIIDHLEVELDED